jgi:hypothetical protein
MDSLRDLLTVITAGLLIAVGMYWLIYKIRSSL